jgi:hypothetical protein
MAQIRASACWAVKATVFPSASRRVSVLPSRAATTVFASRKPPACICSITTAAIVR